MECQCICIFLIFDIFHTNTQNSLFAQTRILMSEIEHKVTDYALIGDVEAVLVLLTSSASSCNETCAEQIGARKPL